MTTRRPAGYSALSSYSRVEILHLVQTAHERSIPELVEATGLHANTVREHLQRLIDDGYVIARIEHRTTRGRPRVLYRAADGAQARSEIQRERVRAAAERGDLMRRVLPETVSANLSVDAMHQLDAVIDDLVDSGFDPLVDETELTIDISPCAQYAAHAEHREVLCSVHLALIQSVLAEAGGPLSAVGIRASTNPLECVIQLGHADRPVPDVDLCMTAGPGRGCAHAQGVTVDEGELDMELALETERELATH